MVGYQGRGKDFFRHLLSANSSRLTLLRGDPHERGVTGSARRARQEQAARHSEAQRSSTLHQVRTRFDDHTSLHSSLGGSSDDDTEYEGSVGHPIDWTVDNAAPRGSRRPQSAGTDWLIKSPQPGAPTDARLIPNYGGHIAKVIIESSERTPPILECRSKKKPLEAIIRLQDMFDELYELLSAPPLGRLPYIMHQHIDSALISTFVERWQPDTNTLHMP